MADVGSLASNGVRVVHLASDQDFVLRLLGPLLDEAWPGSGQRLVHAYELGYRWHACFESWAVLAEDGCCLAHAGAVVLPVALADQRFEVTALQAVVCTQAARGQGLASACVEAAMSWTVSRAPPGVDVPLLLHALVPRFYRRHGFREYTERRFVLHLHAAAQRDGDWRRLALGDGSVGALLSNIGARRIAITRALACLAPIELVVLDSVLSGREESLWWSPLLDAVIVGDFSETSGDLRDIVATASTDLRDLLATLPGRPREVTVHLSLPLEDLLRGQDGLGTHPLIRDAYRERVFERGPLMRAGTWPEALADLCVPPTMGV